MLISIGNYLHEEAEKYWTINNGDLFGKGLLEDFEKESEFLKQQYTGKVLSFSDNRRGSLPALERSEVLRWQHIVKIEFSPEPDS